MPCAQINKFLLQYVNSFHDIFRYSILTYLKYICAIHAAIGTAPIAPQRHHSLDQLDMLHSRQDYTTNYGMYSGFSNRYLRRDYYNQPSYMSHHRPF